MLEKLKKIGQYYCLKSVGILIKLFIIFIIYYILFLFLINSIFPNTDIDFTAQNLSSKFYIMHSLLRAYSSNNIYNKLTFRGYLWFRWLRVFITELVASFFQNSPILRVILAQDTLLFLIIFRNFIKVLML